MVRRLAPRLGGRAACPPHGGSAVIPTHRVSPVSDSIWGTEQPKTDVAAAARFLNERVGQPERGLTVIGFSLGAYYALHLSVTNPEHIRSVVIFYGTRLGDYSSSKAAYLGHFAEMDEFESESDVTTLEESLKRAGCPVTFYRYSDTAHWFFEPDRPEFNQTAAELAWVRTLGFLEESLVQEGN